MEHFCNCPVESCVNHPVNHSAGCDMCIEKNLRQDEIPACFFLKVSKEVNDLRDFSTASFVEFFLKHKKGLES